MRRAQRIHLWPDTRVIRVKTFPTQSNPWCGLAAASLGLLMACDGLAGRSEEPLGLTVTPLLGTSCGDPDAPTPNLDPFLDAPNNQSHSP